MDQPKQAGNGPRPLLKKVAVPLVAGAVTITVVGVLYTLHPRDDDSDRHLMGVMMFPDSQMTCPTAAPATTAPMTQPHGQLGHKPGNPAVSTSPWQPASPDEKP